MARNRAVARLRDRDDGAQMVEFALLTPLIIVLVTGIIAFGFILWALIAAYHGAREGARLAAVGVDDCSAWTSTVAGRATSVDITSLDLDYDTGSPKAGDTVTVTMVIDADNSTAGFLAAATSLIPGGSVLLPDTFTITASSRAELIGSQTSCSS